MTEPIPTETEAPGNTPATTTAQQNRRRITTPIILGALSAVAIGSALLLTLKPATPPMTGQAVNVPEPSHTNTARTVPATQISTDQQKSTPPSQTKPAITGETVDRQPEVKEHASRTVNFTPDARDPFLKSSVSNKSAIDAISAPAMPPVQSSPVVVSAQPITLPRPSATASNVPEQSSAITISSQPPVVKPNLPAPPQPIPNPVPMPVEVSPPIQIIPQGEPRRNVTPAPKITVTPAIPSAPTPVPEITITPAKPVVPAQTPIPAPTPTTSPAVSPKLNEAEEWVKAQQIGYGGSSIAQGRTSVILNTPSGPIFADVGETIPGTTTKILKADDTSLTLQVNSSTAQLKLP